MSGQVRPGLRSWARLPLPLLLAAALGGCIREQAEDVFARQNAAVAAFAQIGESGPSVASSAGDLNEVEAQLNRACDALNAAASRRMSGAPEDEGFDLDILLSLDECANRTWEAERAIRVAAPSLALEMFGDAPLDNTAPPFTH